VGVHYSDTFTHASLLLLQSAVDEISADVSSEDETMEAVAQAGAAMGR
jgi:hypothetical protein